MPLAEVERDTGSDLLDRMRSSPMSGWSIADVERVCRAYARSAVWRRLTF
jgi:hypothetical protein